MQYADEWSVRGNGKRVMCVYVRWSTAWRKEGKEEDERKPDNDC